MTARGMPATVNGYDSYEVTSALQKSIRRGKEEDAMQWALELCHSSKAHFTHLLNRLRTIALEDIGLADKAAVSFALVAADAISNRYQKPPWRIGVANIVLALCRADKTREADHFVAVMQAQWDDGGPGKVPDYALDGHTKAGRKKGRGATFFVEEASKTNRRERSEYHERWVQLMKSKEGGDASTLF